jgi:hypothetical protein
MRLSFWRKIIVNKIADKFKQSKNVYEISEVK